MPTLKQGQRHAVRFELNGVAVTGHAEPRMLLSDFLREVLGATGTHVGCEQGICGACTVRLDGVVVRACLTLAQQADGRRVETVEGLSPSAEQLTRLQQAFRRQHALQCGFCTPGFLMLAAAVLEDDPEIGEAELREALASNLCRCTGYVNIMKAVRAAAQEMQEMKAGR